MATSGIIAAGQIPITCQLCEDGGKIKWKCTDCDLLLCENCKNNIHPKFKNATGHNIVDLKHVGTRTEISDIKCAEHPGKEYCMFCKTCNNLICPVCIPNSHNGHKIDRITTPYSSSGPEQDTKLIVTKEFQTELGLVSALACDGNLAWIADGASPILQMVKLNGTTLAKVFNFKVNVYGMALNQSGDLLMSDNGQKLKLIDSTTGELKDSIYSLSPLETTVVHVTLDGRVIVGAGRGKDGGENAGRRTVIVLGEDGEQKAIYEYNKENKPIFQYPFYITSCRNGNIFVVDRLSSDCKGQVVVLGKPSEGVIKMYKGRPDINTSMEKYNPFCPTDLVTTALDNVIVNDEQAMVFHFLNNEGQFLTSYDIKRLFGVGIVQNKNFPSSLCFSSPNQLCLGCYVKNDSPRKAKLYICNVSDL